MIKSTCFTNQIHRAHNPQLHAIGIGLIFPYDPWILPVRGSSMAPRKAAGAFVPSCSSTCRRWSARCGPGVVSRRLWSTRSSPGRTSWTANAAWTRRDAGTALMMQRLYDRGEKLMAMVCYDDLVVVGSCLLLV